MTPTSLNSFPAPSGAGSTEFNASSDFGAPRVDGARREDEPSFEDVYARGRDTASDTAPEKTPDEPSAVSSDEQTDEAREGEDVKKHRKPKVADAAPVETDEASLVTTSVRDAAMMAPVPVIVPDPIVAPPTAECAQPVGGNAAPLPVPVLPIATPIATANPAAAAPQPVTPSAVATVAPTNPENAAPSDAEGKPLTAKTATPVPTDPEAKVTLPTNPEGEQESDASAGNQEKSAAHPAPKVSLPKAPSEKNFLSAEDKEVVKEPTPAGTGVANSLDKMKPATQLFPRPEGSSAFNRGGALTASESFVADEFAVAWKGWTNGGGERVSTAAQFLRLGDKAPSVHTPFFAGPGFPASRTQVTPAEAAAPTARAFPEEPKALLAPIGSALERLVSNGRDQLSLTVRFEQGGSLSLKLALRDGQVSTQIQTDVPGLEGAIKSAWGQLSQEWQGRGTKLADPQFVGGGTTSQHDKPAADGRNANRDSQSGDAGTASFARDQSNSSGRRATSASAETTSTTSTGTTASKRRGLLTWA